MIRRSHSEVNFWRCQNYRARYLELVKKINEEILGGDYLKQRLEHYVPLIDSYVEKDTRKLSSYEAFTKVTSLKPSPGAGQPQGREMSLLDFAAGRYRFLKEYKAPAASSSKP